MAFFNAIFMIYLKYGDNMFRRYLIIILIVLMVVLGCSKGNKVHSKDYFYMDTYINVKIYGNDKNNKRSL